MTLAIDFGTSNTVIARWNAATQKPEAIALPGLAWQFSTSPSLVPSLVYVNDASTPVVTLGQAVRDQGLDVAQDNRFFRNFKRGIGTSVQGFMPELEGQQLNFEKIGQWFLSQVIESTRQQVGDLESIIFTVPVDSFEAYRLWLGQLCQTLDVPDVRLLDEPTAAALGYGLSGGETVLVLDFGGGTLDFSLVQLTGDQSRKPLGFILKWGQKSMAEASSQQVKTAKVLAKSGENLGGADIDSWLAEYFYESQGLPITPLTLRLAEQLKIRLSSQAIASESYFDDETLDAYELSLDQTTFDQILQQQGFFERLEDRLAQILQQARRQGIDKDDIQAVLLVGGTAQIPAVQNWVAKEFKPEKIRQSQPFTAIAEGALQLQQGLELKDFLYHGYGIRFWDRRQNCHSWHPLIRQGQAYPMTQSVDIVLGASLDNQPSIELVIGELGDDAMATEVYYEGNRLVTRRRSGQGMVQPLNDRDGARAIAALTPPGVPGKDRIKVSFKIDENRFLRMTVDDLLTAETLVHDQSVVQLS